MFDGHDGDDALDGCQQRVDGVKAERGRHHPAGSRGVETGECGDDGGNDDRKDHQPNRPQEHLARKEDVGEFPRSEDRRHDSGRWRLVVAVVGRRRRLIVMNRFWRETNRENADCRRQNDGCQSGDEEEVIFYRGEGGESPFFPDRDRLFK